MIKLSDVEVRGIIEAYKNRVFPTEEVEAISAKRIEICMVCPHIGTNIVGNLKCSVCGCALKNKTRSPRTKCPDGRWAAEI